MFGGIALLKPAIDAADVLFYGHQLLIFHNVQMYQIRDYLGKKTDAVLRISWGISICTKIIFQSMKIH